MPWLLSSGTVPWTDRKSNRLYTVHNRQRGGCSDDFLLVHLDADAGPSGVELVLAIGLDAVRCGVMRESERGRVELTAGTVQLARGVFFFFLVSCARSRPVGLVLGVGRGREDGWKAERWLRQRTVRSGAVGRVEGAYVAGCLQSLVQHSQVGLSAYRPSSGATVAQVSSESKEDASEEGV
ncbi:hypothetical protein BKA81DRAFT_367271 [Phyllosticta paracitricarpa]